MAQERAGEAYISLILAAPTVVAPPMHPVATSESLSDQQSTSRGNDDELNGGARNAQGKILQPTIREKMVEEGGAIAQQDGASPHKGRDTEKKLNEAGRECS